jgi:hypothetical protein
MHPPPLLFLISSQDRNVDSLVFVFFQIAGDIWLEFPVWAFGFVLIIWIFGGSLIFSLFDCSLLWQRFFLLL